MLQLTLQRLLAFSRVYKMMMGHGCPIIWAEWEEWTEWEGGQPWVTTVDGWDHGPKPRDAQLMASSQWREPLGGWLESS